MKKFPKPSPAMVVACVALFVALGGSATAAIVITGKNVKNYSLSGKDIKKNSLGGVPIKETSLKTVPSANTLAHSAVVTGAGALVRGKGIVGAVRTAPGRYQLTFNQNVQGCVAVASVSDPSAATPPNGQATTSLIAANPNAVQVRTSVAGNNGDVTADRSFSLLLSC